MSASTASTPTGPEVSATTVPVEGEWPVPQRIKDAAPELWRASFDDAAGRFNFHPHTSFQPVMAALVVNEIRRLAGQLNGPVAVLDIGCGRGIGSHVEYQWMIRRRVGEYQGVEPDPDVPIDPKLFDRVQRTVLEKADLPPRHFDLAYSCFVMEHVSDPAGFFKAAFATLRPGGVLLTMTPNAAAFFGFVSRWLHRMRVDEWLHALLYKNAEYKPDHYEVASRCNTQREFRRHATAAGFGAPAFAYFQLDGLQGYFRGPLKPGYHILMAKRKLFRSPSALDTLVCRLQRPA
jgi:SAM-dependent methyltransferase